MNEQIRDLIDAIVDENSVDAEKIFNNAMYDKISNNIETFRKEVANMYFNTEAVKPPSTLGGTDHTPAESPDGDEAAPAPEEETPAE